MDKNVCILDDSEMMRVFLGKLCERFANVTLHSNPISLLKMIDHGYSPDLILLDLKMPGLSGIEFLQLLNEKGKIKTIRVIIVSGVDNAQEKINCLSLGAWDYLIKPFHPKELEIKIQRALLTSSITQVVGTQAI
jgi:DNA-binding response OmpR family regulator